MEGFGGSHFSQARIDRLVKGGQVSFSEVSPRPHDTGMVTMISQDLSELALHGRAILGLPIDDIAQHGASASYVVLGEGLRRAAPARVIVFASMQISPARASGDQPARAWQASAAELTSEHGSPLCAA